MTSLRLRHPKGVCSIQAQLDNDAFTVRDLQQEIYAATGISPSRQLLKVGYPPRTLAAVPQLPISSLGITSGDQIIVNESADPTMPTSDTNPLPSLQTSNFSTGLTPSGQIPSPTAASHRPDHVETEGGVLIHRVVPDDNSCLFSAISLIFEQNINKAQQMREIVARGIHNDPATYNEAILGMSPERYISTIRKPMTWGGAIELGILASHYQTEIASIDVETGRIDKFSATPGGAGMRCILIYSGIHYDAVSLAPFLDAPHEWHQTIFPVSSANDDDPILVAAKKLSDILRAKRAYTNTTTFDLRCEACSSVLDARFIPHS
ncbi:hypothetical protein AX17_002859 [Amanita inopinata Kibby_2008]|nr:hypothetical protein AX17_002859 [Amanita inopinata Kibby_2008]